MFAALAATQCDDVRSSFPRPAPPAGRNQLLRYANASTRVGVIGIGGLGHLALQYANAFGCRVTAFTTTPDKAAEARELGANTVVDVSTPGALAAQANSCDLLLCTAIADIPWNEYVGVLRRNGKLCLLGIPAHDLSLSAIPLIFFQRSVVSSGIGSRKESERCWSSPRCTASGRRSRSFR